MKYRNKETPYEIQSEEDWKKVKTDWYVSYICNACRIRHIKKVLGVFGIYYLKDWKNINSMVYEDIITSLFNSSKLLSEYDYTFDNTTTTLPYLMVKFRDYMTSFIQNSTGNTGSGYLLYANVFNVSFSVLCYCTDWAR